MKTPTTIPTPARSSAEITAEMRRLGEIERRLCETRAALYTAGSGSPEAEAESDYVRAVKQHLASLRAGAPAAPYQTAPAFGRDAALGIECEAIRQRIRELVREHQDAAEAEAQAAAAAMAAEWGAVARDIVLTATRLHGLEEKIRRMMEATRGIPVTGLALGSILGSGYSFLGIGNPLEELHRTALKERVVSQSDLRKAQDV